jgi:hypothetical protein
MRRVLAVPLLLCGALACYARTPIDETPPPDGYSIRDTLPKSASLARRLAEAADGYRDGKPKWVVANRERKEGNHRVVGVFSTFAEADFVARREGPPYAAFGPYRTAKEGYDYPPEERVSVVVVRYLDGQEKRYNPDSVDALFWGLPAFDKFIVPYLSSVYSVEYAKRQRDLYAEGRSPFANSEQVAHKRGSF